MAKRLNFASADFLDAFERLLGSKREVDSDVHDAGRASLPISVDGVTMPYWHSPLSMMV